MSIVDNDLAAILTIAATHSAA